MKLRDKIEEVSTLVHRPWSARIEFVRGCNIKCDFCAIHSIPKKKKYIKKETAILIAKGLAKAGFDPIRLEFGMRGEPILHPDFMKLIKIFRRYCEKSPMLVYSNGIAFSRDDAERFFDVGGNILLIDCYSDGLYDKYLEKYDGLHIIDYYNEKFSPWHRHNPKKTKVLLLMRDFGVGISGKKITRILTNQGGNLVKKTADKYGIKVVKEPLKKKCCRLFRDIVFMYNGNCTICCLDWGEKVVFFNVNSGERIKRFWYKDYWLNAMRLLHYNKNRKFSPCFNCNYMGGTRFGFLPKVAELSKKEQQKLIDEISSAEHIFANLVLEKQRRKEGIKLYHEE